jgi:hypothetical protein
VAGGRSLGMAQNLKTDGLWAAKVDRHVITSLHQRNKPIHQIIHELQSHIEERLHIRITMHSWKTKRLINIAVSRVAFVANELKRL